MCRECFCAKQRAWRKTQGGQEATQKVYQRRKAEGVIGKPYAQKTPAERKALTEAVKRWRDKNRDRFNAEMETAIIYNFDEGQWATAVQEVQHVQEPDGC